MENNTPSSSLRLADFTPHSRISPENCISQFSYHNGLTTTVPTNTTPGSSQNSTLSHIQTPHYLEPADSQTQIPEYIPGPGHNAPPSPFQYSLYARPPLLSPEDEKDAEIACLKEELAKIKRQLAETQVALDDRNNELSNVKAELAGLKAPRNPLKRHRSESDLYSWSKKIQPKQQRTENLSPSLTFEDRIASPIGSLHTNQVSFKS